MENKMKVGDKFFVRITGAYRKDNPKEMEVKVSKIGKKYFYLEGYPRLKFDLKTSRPSGETYNTWYEFFASKEDMIKEIERRIIYNKYYDQIKEHFGQYHHNTSISLEQLIKIKEILNL